MASFKLTIDGTEYENTLGVSIRNTRTENNISTLELIINNYQSSAYTDIIDLFSTVQLDLKNKNNTYTTTFYGEVFAVQPAMAPEVLTVYCKGMEHSMQLTHCDESYGSESMEPDAVADSPRHLFQKYINEHLENSFGDAEATNWALNESDTYIEDVHNGLSITNLTSKYHSVFTMFNRLADIVTAYALTQGGGAEPGIHWFVDPTSASPRIYLKEIGADHSSGNWDKYYGGSQSAATVTQGDDILEYKLHKDISHYANNVILACALRKPAYDYWTEDADTNELWTVTGDGATADDAVNYIVGADSLKFTNDANRAVTYHMDFDNNLDFDYLGSQDSIPFISLYGRRNDVAAGGGTSFWIRLYTTRGTDYYYLALFDDTGWFGAQDKVFMPEKARFYNITLPVGKYSNIAMPDRGWDAQGSPDWSDIDGIEFYFNNLGYAGAHSFWLDDLHISGHIIREARDASEAGTYKERQVFLRLDTAIDDSCTTSDNTGTAARLAAAELFKRIQFQTSTANRLWTGQITMPMKEDLLPGQQLYVNCGKLASGSYRHQLDMRCKAVIQEVSRNGYLTKVNLTSDLYNSLTFDMPSAWGILQESAGALGHAEARDLKASGVDLGIPRLSWDPTT